jgi:hypothetical protein
MIALLAVALLLVGALLALTGPRHCPVNRRAIERIKKGMTRAEVHAILGGPGGDYRTQPAQHHINGFGIVDFMGNESWRGDSMGVCVAYDTEDRVEDFRGWDVVNQPPTTLEIARWRLNRLLRRKPD